MTLLKHAATLRGTCSAAVHSNDMSSPLGKLTTSLSSMVLENLQTYDYAIIDNALETSVADGLRRDVETMLKPAMTPNHTHVVVDPGTPPKLFPKHNILEYDFKVKGEGLLSSSLSGNERGTDSGFSVPATERGRAKTALFESLEADSTLMDVLNTFNNDYNAVGGGDAVPRMGKPMVHHSHENAGRERHLLEQGCLVSQAIKAQWNSGMLMYLYM